MTKGYLIEVWYNSKIDKGETHLFDMKADTMTEAIRLKEANEEYGRYCKVYTLTEVKFSEDEQ